MIRAIVIVGVVAPTLAAEPPQLPDEFPITDSIVMTDSDEFYISPEVAYFRLADEKRLSVATELAYGLTDRFQMRAEVPYDFVNPDHARSADGVGDVEVAARYGVLDYRKRPFGLDVGLGIVTPSGDRTRDLGEGRVQIEPFFTASQWVGPVNIQLNFAWQRAISEAGNDPKDDYEYNVAVCYPIHRWFLILEGNGATDSRHTNYYITPGAVWKATEHIEFRIAAPIAVTTAAGDYAIIGGFTIEFEKLFSCGEGAN
jgi:hypothetical protein